jgi:hypothetical protein
MYRIETAERNAYPAGETDVGDKGVAEPDVGDEDVISVGLGATVLPSTRGQHNASSASFNLQY